GLDAVQDVTITGGTVIATGEKLTIPKKDSPQKHLYIQFDSDQPANQLITLIESDPTTGVRPDQTSDESKGQHLLTFSPAQGYRVFLFSSPYVRSASSYEVYMGGTAKGEPVDGVYST